MEAQEDLFKFDVGQLDSDQNSVRGPGQKKDAASSFCPSWFSPVESFLVVKVSIGERRRCADIDRVVT